MHFPKLLRLTYWADAAPHILAIYIFKHNKKQNININEPLDFIRANTITQANDITRTNTITWDNTTTPCHELTQ